jgi:RNA polymerase sigma-70 factor (ECF subfamily)
MDKKAWLPEPLLLDFGQENPEQTFLQKETLSFALLTLLQQLNPVERAVFLLREVFGFDYSEVAKIIEKTESFICMFLKGIHSDQIDEFVQFIAKEAIAYTDGRGRFKTAVNPIVTRERITQYLTGILRKVPESVDVNALSFTPIQMNGEIGLAVSLQDQLLAILALRVTNNQIQNLYFVFNPDKLRHAASVLQLNVTK